MPKRRNDEFTVSAISNEESYRFYLNRMIELSIAMFDWQNLPETCDVRYLETTLFTNGSAVFFKDPELDALLCLDYVQKGNFNVYGYPVKYDAYSKYNNYRIPLSLDNSVICYNNMIKQNSVSGATYYAKRLWALDRIIDINANAQKTPVLLQGTEKDRLTLQNLYKEYDGNAPVIYGSKNLDPNSLSVLKTDAPFLADKLYQLKSDIWNEALTFLGITNVNVNKKERLITDEVERSQGGTIASRYSRLQARKDAADKINKMFGTNIKVEFKEDVLPEVPKNEMPDETIEEEEENNE